MDHHDVARLHERRELLGVSTRDVVVVRPFARAEVAAVALVSVQSVVDPLRDLEEPGVALEDGPSDAYAVPGEIAEVRSQQLGDAAAFCGGVDVPQRVRAKRRACAGERNAEPIDVAVADDRQEARGGAWRNRCLVHASARIVAWLGLDIANEGGPRWARMTP